MVEINYLESIKKQFLYYKTLGEKAMNQLEPEQLFVSINKDTNSIATIVTHLSGNMLSRWTDFITTEERKNGEIAIQNLKKPSKAKKLY